MLDLHKGNTISKFYGDVGALPCSCTVAFVLVTAAFRCG